MADGFNIDLCKHILVVANACGFDFRENLSQQWRNRFDSLAQFFCSAAFIVNRRVKNSLTFTATTPDSLESYSVVWVFPENFADFGRQGFSQLVNREKIDALGIGSIQNQFGFFIERTGRVHGRFTDLKAVLFNHCLQLLLTGMQS